MTCVFGEGGDSRPFEANGDSTRGENPDGWVGIVVNRCSGAGAGARKVARLVEALRERQLAAEIAWTLDERSALVAKADGDPRCRCLVAVGGDGTISALVNEGPRVPITALRAGTENLFVRHFKLRDDPEELARTIATGKAVWTDVGLANGRRFILMAGFGFDGDVVTRHHDLRTSRTGAVQPTHRAAYVEPILRSSFSYGFPEIRVRIEDLGREETLVGTTVFVFNLPRYALGIPFVPESRQDDGLLDLIVFREPGPFQALCYLWRVVLGAHLDDPGVSHRRARRFSLESDAVVPVQIDGDPAGHLLPKGGDPSLEVGAPMATTGERWTIQVVPKAARILVDAAWEPDVPSVALAGDQQRR